jgi:hypothetical protein
MHGAGKRGGGRAVTHFYDEAMPVFPIALYAKSRQSDLTLTDAIRRRQGR